MNVEIKNMRKVDKNAIKANCTVVVDEAITVYNCKLIYSDKKERYYFFLPSRQYKDSYFDEVKFSDSLHDKALVAAVAAYNALCDEK